MPSELGGLPTPGTGEYLQGTGAQVLDNELKVIVPETGKDVTAYYINGAKYTLEIAEIVGARKAYLKSGSPACDVKGVTGELLTRASIRVIKVP